MTGYCKNCGSVTCQCPAVRARVVDVKTITTKDAFSIVLSDIAVHCYEAIKAKDYARAIVWCEVGLSIVLVDKKVSEIVQGAAKDTSCTAPPGMKCTNPDCVRR